MGKMKLAALALAAFAVFFAFVATLIWKTGYSVPEMDWDSDGSTSIGEMLRAIDVGHRQIEEDGVKCQEFFSFKDGLPIRITCPDHSMDLHPTHP